MTEIFAVDALDFRLKLGTWDFARDRADEIAAHWARRKAEQPRLFNGRVLMLGRHELRGGVLSGDFFETDFMNFLAWREFGFPSSNALNGFAMAALRGSDGAFLLGEMSEHTASAGRVYFAAGTPDPQDAFGDVVDLYASVTRELTEETGLRPEEAEIARGWIVARDASHVACMKPIRLKETAAQAKARIDAWLAADPHPEFVRMHVIGGAAEITQATPPFVRDFLVYMFEGGGGLARSQDRACAGTTRSGDRVYRCGCRRPRS